MSEIFISEEIEVNAENGTPKKFIWRDVEYSVEKILSSRVDRRFGKAAPKKKTWRLRHHRNYYRLKTDKGIFEIYQDWGAKNRPWVVLKKL